MDDVQKIFDEVAGIENDIRTTVAEMNVYDRITKNLFSSASDLLTSMEKQQVAEAVFDPAPDKLLTVEDVVRLPELGGLISKKAVREAVTSGALRPIRAKADGKKQFFTRTIIQEWRSACQQQTPISSSAMPVMTKPVASRTKRLGLSMTERAALAQDAARMMRMGQKKS